MAHIMLNMAERRFLHDTIRHDHNNDQFYVYNHWIYRNAYRAFTQQHSLMNDVG
jgi:myosin-crossreactive antigen